MHIITLVLVNGPDYGVDLDPDLGRDHPSPAHPTNHPRGLCQVRHINSTAALSSVQDDRHERNLNNRETISL